MKTVYWAASGAMFLTLGCSTAAFAAGDAAFCEEVKTIAGDAAHAFSMVQGDKTSQEASTVDPSVIVDHYSVKASLDGATSCEMTVQETATSDGRHFPNYSCYFPITGSDKGAATRKLANRVAACLPGISHPSGPGLKKDGGMLTAHSADYDVSYSFISGSAQNRVVFSIQSDKN